jgi:hypothetical protein
MSFTVRGNHARPRLTEPVKAAEPRRDGSLQHERYKKLIVEVEDPTEMAARLRQAISKKKT